MDIWIDGDSGTWGTVASVRIIKDLSPDEVEMLDRMSDEERCELALVRGSHPLPKEFLLGQIDDAFHERRVMIADEAPPNETQEIMTEGVIYGLDIAQEIVHSVLE